MQKLAYELRISDWSSDVCSSDLRGTCRTVDRDTPLLGNILRGITIQSMRPVGGSGGDPHPPANDQSVRGNFAEFHTQPTTRGVRVLACRSEEHTSELQSLMRISYAVFCLKKKK